MVGGFMEGILILLQKQMIWVLNDINICEEWVKQGTNFTKSVSLLTILHIAVVFTHSSWSSHGPRNYFYILHTLIESEMFLSLVKLNHLLLKRWLKILKKQKELTNEELRTILAPIVIFQKVETKKEKKRFFIASKVITNEEVISTLKESEKK